jgi:putative nucleotidyltransferase with HDIG domain
MPSLVRSLLYRTYYAALVLLAAYLLVRGASTIDAAPWAAVVLWVGLMTLTEAAPITLPGGGIITVSSVLDYAGLIVFGPYLTAWIDVFSMLLGRAVLRERRPVYKSIFNLSLFVVTTVTAGEVFRAAGGTVGRLDLPAHFPAVLAMGAAYFLMNTSGVSLVISLTSGVPLDRVWRTNFRWTIFHLLALVPFGCIVALMYLQLGYLGVLLFMFPLLLARHSFKLYSEMRQDFMDFVGTLASLIEEVDPYTRHHSHRVAQYARQIATELELPAPRVDTIATAALLHDIGKVSFRMFDIIESPGKLTREQRLRIARHPEVGAAIVSRVRMLKDVAEVVRFHHERMDGTGYPLGLKGAAIPIGARILMVADALDAMTSDRSYRRAHSLDAALVELKRQAGLQFDAEVVAAVERLHHRGELNVLYQSQPTAEPLVDALRAGER